MFKITETVQLPQWREIMDFKERDAIGDFHGDLDAKEPRHVKNLRIMNASLDVLTVLKAGLFLAEMGEPVGLTHDERAEREIWMRDARAAIAKAEGKK